MNKRIGIMGLLTGMGLSGILKSFMSVSMPYIVSDLGSSHLYNWVFTSYLLASTISIPFFAKLADCKSRKLLFCIGEVIILVFVFLSTFSKSMQFLIFCRFCIGIGAGVSVPSSWALVTDLCLPEEVPKLMGFSGLVQVLSNIIGPVWGGFTTEYLNWKLGLLTLLPIIAISIIFIYMGVPKKQVKSEKIHIDFIGTILSSIIIIMLLIMIDIIKVSFGLFFTMIILVIILVIIFVRHEKNIENPIVPIKLFGESIFAVLAILTFLYGIFNNGLVSYLPLVFSITVGSSSAQSGIMFLPMMIFAGLGSWFCGRVSEKYRHIIALLSLGLSTISACIFAFGIVHNPIFVICLTLPFGLSIGYILPMLMNENVKWVSDKHPGYIGSTSGILQLMRNLGGTLGVAILGLSLKSEKIDVGFIFSCISLVLGLLMVSQFMLNIKNRN